MDVLEVRHPYDGTVVGRVDLAGPAQVEAAVAAAHAVASEAARLPA
ncbi:MAG: hypothetical protein QOJ49_189, partial [Actinomycetota bacterium]|nr:hypothetical protein [Actinomycetota bacterium]